MLSSFVMLLPSQSYCTYGGQHPVFSHPHFNAMMMSSKKFCFITKICLDEAAWTQAFQFIWGPWHSKCCTASTICFPCFCTQLSGPCMFTRSYHHVSFPQTFFTTTPLSLCDHRTISQSPPQNKAQKAWDTPRVETVSAALLDQRLMPSLGLIYLLSPGRILMPGFMLSLTPHLTLEWTTKQLE